MDLTLDELELLKDVKKVTAKDDGYYVTYDNKTEKKVLQLQEKDIKLLRKDQINGLLRITIIFLVILIVGLVLNYFQKKSFYIIQDRRLSTIYETKCLVIFKAYP